MTRYDPRAATFGAAWARRPGPRPRFMPLHTIERRQARQRRKLARIIAAGLGRPVTLRDLFTGARAAMVAFGAALQRIGEATAGAGTGITRAFTPHLPERHATRTIGLRLGFDSDRPIFDELTTRRTS